MTRKSFISVCKSTTKGLQTHFMDVREPRKRFGRAEIIHIKQTVYLQPIKGKQGSKEGIMSKGYLSRQKRYMKGKGVGLRGGLR